MNASASCSFSRCIGYVPDGSRAAGGSVPELRENCCENSECICYAYSLVVLPLPALCFLFLPTFTLVSVLQKGDVADELECVKPTPCQRETIYSKTDANQEGFHRDLQLEGA